MQDKLSKLILGSIGLLLCCGRLPAASPWASLIPYKRVTADPNKSYALAEEHGPWLILAANFDGPTAEQRARDLVLELRSKYRLPAYIHKQTYDFTQPIEAMTPRGTTARMRYANQQKYEGVAVLVGNFRSVQDPAVNETLERIKFLKPESLGGVAEATSSNRFAVFTGLKRRTDSNAKQKRGPMGSAFVTRNPLLPDHVSAPNGVDSFVAKLNRGVEFSLLDNPGRYTVRVATFQGSATINQREIESIELRDKLSDKLQVAADKAHRLTVALRQQGIEAYEFHDRMESCVTIGSFDSEKQTPTMYKIVERYRAKERPAPNKNGMSVQPEKLAGINFDVNPTPMEVPRRSVAADYARRSLE